MNFIMDVFFEFLAMLLGLVGLICGFAGVLIALIGLLVTYVDITQYVSISLPSWFGWILGVMVLIVGILLMSLSSVMRKRISNPRR